MEKRNYCSHKFTETEREIIMAVKSTTIGKMKTLPRISQGKKIVTGKGHLELSSRVTGHKRLRMVFKISFIRKDLLLIIKAVI